MSARIMVRNGPGSSRDMSRTRTPCSASASPSDEDTVTRRRLSLTGDLEQLLELHRQHRIAGHPELALEVQLHARVGVAEHGLEVLVGDLDRALRLAAVALDAGRRVGDEIDRPIAAAFPRDLEAVDGVQLARLVRELLETFRDQVIEQILRILGQRSHVCPPPACYRGRSFQSTLTAENAGGRAGAVRVGDTPVATAEVTATA